MTPGLWTRMVSQGPARPRASPGEGNSPLPSDHIIKCNHITEPRLGLRGPSQHIPGSRARASPERAPPMDAAQDSHQHTSLDSTAIPRLTAMCPSHLDVLSPKTCLLSAWHVSH